MINIVMDMMVIIVVGYAMYHMIKLKKDINNLKESRKSMEIFLNEFNESLVKSQHLLGELQDNKKEIIDKGKEQTELAQKLTEDLKFLVERGEWLVDRLQIKSSDLANRGDVIQMPTSRPEKSLLSNIMNLR